MKAAHQAAKDRPEIVVKAEEVSDITFARGTGPSLLARRTWNLLIQAAAGDGWEDKAHSIKKRDLCCGWHIGPAEIADTLAELQTTLIRRRITRPNGKPAVLTTALLSSTIEEKANDDESRVFFRFSPEMREMLRTIRYYVELEKLVFLSFTCKYAHPLYERGIRKLRDTQVNETIKLEDLRAILGVPDGTLDRWPDLKRRVVEPAVAEVNLLAPFIVRWAPVNDTTTRRHNPPVLAVEFFYDMKDGEMIADARAELQRPKIGRRARRTKAVERLIEQDAAFSAEVRASLPAPVQVDLEDVIAAQPTP
jgi:hypothetical protein